MDGTHCAVGYRSHRASDDALVDIVRGETNNGYVLRDLLAYPELAAWAAAHGFTTEELAWIQPGYDATYILNPEPCGAGLGVEGGSVLAAAAFRDGILLGGDFTSVDGGGAIGASTRFLLRSARRRVACLT